MGKFIIIIGSWEGSATNQQDIIVIPQAYRPAFDTRGSGSIAFSSNVGFPCDYVVYSGGSVRQAQNTSPGLNGSFVIAYYTN